MNKKIFIGILVAILIVGGAIFGIVKNEEKNLSRCLNSVKEVVDEIILVDTGSTDTTKEIGENFGAKIYDYVWDSNFSNARNFALSKSTGNWILYLDADEYLSKDCIEELLRIVEEDGLLGVKCSVNSKGSATVIDDNTRHDQRQTEDGALGTHGGEDGDDGGSD